MDEQKLAILEAAVERTGGRKVQYISATKEDCLAACQSMVLLMTGRNPTEAKKLAPSIPKEQQEEAERQMSALSKWMADRISNVRDSMGVRLSDRIYNHCLLDCVDDSDRNFPKQLAQCWISAKTPEDEESCNQLAADWRIRAKAEQEVKEMKGIIETVEKTAGKESWREYLGLNSKGQEGKN